MFSGTSLERGFSEELESSNIKRNVSSRGQVMVQEQYRQEYSTGGSRGEWFSAL